MLFDHLRLLLVRACYVELVPFLVASALLGVSG